MDLKDIQELIKFVAKSGATEVDLEFDNVKISIKSPSKKRRGEVDEVTTIIQQVPGQVGVAPIVSAAAPIASTPAPAADENANYITIKASMIGTFYRSSSPEIPPFIDFSIVSRISMSVISSKFMSVYFKPACHVNPGEE